MSDLSEVCATYFAELEGAGASLPAPLAIALHLCCFDPLCTKPITSFDKMPLSEGLRRRIRDVGFASPTIVQQRTIRPFVRGRDVVVVSPSGSGCTSTYAIGILESVDFDRQATQALVVCPSRERGLRAAKQIRMLGEGGAKEGAAERPWCVDIVGSTSVLGTLRQLQNGPQIVIGTPHRLASTFQRILSCDAVTIVVVDDAEMFSKDELDNFFLLLKPNCAKNLQIAAFAKRLPPQLVAFLERWMEDPLMITDLPA